MKLVPADYITDEDRAIQRILDEHPALKWHMALLLNGYSELCEMAIKGMYGIEEAADPADLYKSLCKKNTAMVRYGIPLFESVHDWEEARTQLREAQS